MSISHHSQEEYEAQQRLVEQILGVAKPNFPHGKLSPQDEGELAFAIAADEIKNVVIISFGKPVDWLGLEKKDAIKLSLLLAEKAAHLK